MRKQAYKSYGMKFFENLKMPVLSLLLHVSVRGRFRCRCRVRPGKGIENTVCTV